MRLLVIGGCGFIGSNFVRYVLPHYGPEMISNVDSLTTGRLENLDGVAANYGERYEFLHADANEAEKIEALLSKHQFFGVVHCAASGCDSEVTGALLDRARHHGVRRFLLVSGEGVKPEIDERARAAHRDYGQEVVIVGADQIYGPYQSPSGLVAQVAGAALRGESTSIAQDGSTPRDWLHADDFAAAIFTALLDGTPGSTYEIRSGTMLPPSEVAERVAGLLGAERASFRFETTGGRSKPNVVALDPTTSLAWRPRHHFTTALAETVEWYAANQAWLETAAVR